ncbi:SRPBCC domain-containing protein [Arthrobacter sp. zg-Y877]|uniref:SRPBCC domain-containing protein n=1 Tax=Arthrobacter sp. zg-Y877 TaxID=3049074 RepID=UPI0025A4976F|nr:SRPBCC domain-containing protein [Arthrobacter sp. zg-Y877]MDM7989040.1 SRPBCC domain-containing protein [Arthrobacter sp. zg-Y877]
MPLTSLSTADGTLLISWAFPAPAQAVWAGFTDAALLSQWLGRPTECDVRPRGMVSVDHGGGYLSRSVITDMDRPRKLAMSWEFPEEPESRIVIQLRGTDTGTVMNFAHHDLGTLVDSYGPGWITHLTYMEAAVAGTAIPASQFWSLHATFEKMYAAHLTADTATP